MLPRSEIPVITDIIAFTFEHPNRFHLKTTAQWATISFAFPLAFKQQLINSDLKSDTYLQRNSSASAFGNCSMHHSPWETSPSPSGVAYQGNAYQNLLSLLHNGLCGRYRTLRAGSELTLLVWRQSRGHHSLSYVLNGQTNCHGTKLSESHFG